MCPAQEYDLFVDSHMYMPGYTWTFVVHIVYKIFSCLHTRNDLNKYIYDNYFKQIKAININIFPLN